MDFAQQLEETLKGHVEIAKAGVDAGERHGRAEAFAEVLAWIERNRDAHGMAHTESLRALCEGSGK